MNIKSKVERSINLVYSAVETFPDAKIHITNELDLNSNEITLEQVQAQAQDDRDRISSSSSKAKSEEVKANLEESHADADGEQPKETLSIAPQDNHVSTPLLVDLSTPVKLLNKDRQESKTVFVQ